MLITLDKVSLADISDRLLLSGVSWASYETLLSEVERSGRHFKLTYDSGDLEIELPSQIHEVVTAFVRAMLEAYLFDHRVPFATFGETTWTRQTIEKGLESDACYYVKHADLMGTRLDIDLDRDPAPDLAIEVEATKPLLPKLPVYAAMEIAEIWHVRTSGRVDLLTLVDGKYVSRDRSAAVPFFTVDLIRRFVAVRLQSGHVPALEQFLSESR